MSDDVLRRVMQVIADTQRIPLEKISPDSTFEELQIDSLDGINILFAVENEFNINVPDAAAKSGGQGPCAIDRGKRGAHGWNRRHRFFTCFDGKCGGRESYQ